MKATLKKHFRFLLIPILSIALMILVKYCYWMIQFSIDQFLSDGYSWLTYPCRGFRDQFRLMTYPALGIGLCLYFTLLFWWRYPKKLLLLIGINIGLQVLCIISKVVYVRYFILPLGVDSGIRIPFPLYDAVFLGFQLAIILNFFIKKRMEGDQFSVFSLG